MNRIICKVVDQTQKPARFVAAIIRIAKLIEYEYLRGLVQIHQLGNTYQ